MPDFGNKEVPEVPDRYVATVLMGSWFTAPEDGQAESITAYLSGYEKPSRIRCAIYEKVGANEGILIGYTEELIVEPDWGDHQKLQTQGDWLEFKVISGGRLEAGKDYWLTAWSDGAIILSGRGGKSGYDLATLNKYGAFLERITMQTDISNYCIYCTYTPPPEHMLTVSTTPGGTTDPAPGSYSYPEGTVARVTACPDSGYLFDHWELDGTTRTENPIDILMDADHALHAVFVVAPPPVPVPWHQRKIAGIPVWLLGVGAVAVAALAYNRKR